MYEYGSRSLYFLCSSSENIVIDDDDDDDDDDERIAENGDVVVVFDFGWHSSICAMKNTYARRLSGHHTIHCTYGCTWVYNNTCCFRVVYLNQTCKTTLRVPGTGTISSMFNIDIRYSM